MIETTNLKLKKYEDNDVADPVLAFNPNMDIIEKAFSNISTDAKGTKFDNATNGMTSNNVQGAIEEVFQAGVNVKANMVQAINSKITVPNVTTDNNWDTLKQSVINIKEVQGNAQVSQVLSGATFTNSNGGLLTGTMANRGGAVTVTPSTSNQVKSAGYYSGNITVAGDANLVAGNIVSGKSIFNVAGSATIQSLGGRRMAIGSSSSSTSSTTFTNASNDRTMTSNYITINNFGFVPSVIIVVGKYSTEYMTVFCNILGSYTSPVVRVYSLNANTFSAQGYSTLINGYVTSNNITYNIPVFTGGVSYNWIAYE